VIPVPQKREVFLNENWRNVMKKVSYFLLAVTLVVGVVHGQEESTVPEAKGADELVEEKGRFAGTWFRPNSDIAQYSKLYLWTPVFQFREGGKEKAGTTIAASRGTQGHYAVTDESRAKFEKIVSDTFVEVLGRSKIFEVVDEVGPDTLTVVVAMLDIVSDVPPTRPGNQDAYLSAVGEATFLFELIESKTGVIQARFGERRRIQPRSRMRGVSRRPANSSTVETEVKVWAEQLAEDFRRALEKAHKKAMKSKK
jgi:hypothetical protein